MGNEAQKISPEVEAVITGKEKEKDIFTEEQRRLLREQILSTEEGPAFLASKMPSLTQYANTYKQIDGTKIREDRETAIKGSLQKLLVDYQTDMNNRFSKVSDKITEGEKQARNEIYTELLKEERKARGRATGVGLLDANPERQKTAQDLLTAVTSTENLSEAQKTQITELLGNHKKDLIDKAFLDNVTRAKKRVEQAQADENTAKRQMETAKRRKERWGNAEKAEMVEQKQEKKALTETKDFIERNKNQIREIVSKLLNTTPRLKELLKSLQDPDTATTAQVKRLQKALGTRVDGETPLTVDGSFGPRTYASLEAKAEEPSTLTALETKLSDQTA